MSEKRVVPGEFGGSGPRQILAEALKHSDGYRAVLAVAIGENGEIDLWANDMRPTDLAIMMAKVQGYGLMVINGWDETEESPTT